MVRGSLRTQEARMSQHTDEGRNKQMSERARCECEQGAHFEETTMPTRAEYIQAWYDLYPNDPCPWVLQ